MYGYLILTPILVLAASLFVSWAWTLLQNYVAAHSIGVPIRIIPVSPFNPFWALVDRKVTQFLRRIPFVKEINLVRYGWRGWDIDERWQSHHQLGDAFVHVTPSYNIFFLDNPKASMDLFKRGDDFTRPGWINEVLSVFGPNISSAEGQSWKTQRRVATRCFNEPNNEIVWHETLRLAEDMLEYWSSRKSIKSSAEDIRTLALNVLSKAGFGKSSKFRGHEEEKLIEEGQTLSYRESLALILENCIVIVALGPKTLAYCCNHWLARYLVPEKLQVVNQAVVSFQNYMTTTYEEQKRIFAAGHESSDNSLMTLLVRASQENATKNPAECLTESEIYGNMFTFNFAGHDTTAHSTTFALYFLAANPEVQDWISEEIQEIVGERQLHEMDYRTDYPRFKRCLSVLYETLRLYTIVPAIKWTGDRATTLTIEGKEMVLPPKTIVLPSYNSLHTNPKYWGSDSLEWRPSRWIMFTDESNIHSKPGNEDMDMNERGTFLGWSAGKRDCPGKQFSQVEFVALMVSLFREWRVDPVQNSQGESMEAARQRVLDLIHEDSGWTLLFQMLHPERAPLAWRKK